MDCTCDKRPSFPLKVRAQVNGLERIISFQPGYVCERTLADFNAPNAPNGHGWHGGDLLFLVKGKS